MHVVIKENIENPFLDSLLSVDFCRLISECRQSLISSYLYDKTGTSMTKEVSAYILLLYME